MKINHTTSKALVILTVIAFLLQGCQHNYYRSKRRGGGKKGCGCPGGFTAERSTKDEKTSTKATNAFVYGNVFNGEETKNSISSQP